MLLPTEEMMSSRLSLAQREGCLSADILIGCGVSAQREEDAFTAC